jgi:hypothetical protein
LVCELFAAIAGVVLIANARRVRSQFAARA